MTLSPAIPLLAESAQPLVSVVTPVHNGEPYLAECIESVLAQTYGNWEYVIVNNCSTDGTRRIAEEYARQDRRIRLVDTDSLLPVIRNWNHALRQIDPASRYCKVVHADDCLMAGCIERMVAVAEAHPDVGIVGAYSLYGRRVKLDGFPYPQEVMSGREICRSTLLGGPYVFGSPTALLLRSELIRESEGFYDEGELHADKIACFDVLRHWDFGFVHQVLTYTRVHDESITASFSKRVLAGRLTDVIVAKRFGPVFLSRDEYPGFLEKHLDRYYRFLAKSYLRPSARQTWQYHREGFARTGEPFLYLRLLRAWIPHQVMRILTGEILRTRRRPGWHGKRIEI